LAPAGGDEHQENNPENGYQLPIDVFSHYLRIGGCSQNLIVGEGMTTKRKMIETFTSIRDPHPGHGNLQWGKDRSAEAPGLYRGVESYAGHCLII
jgi:hypothetical protein